MNTQYIKELAQEIIDATDDFEKTNQKSEVMDFYKEIERIADLIKKEVSE